YSQLPRLYSTELIAFRQRMHLTHVDTLIFPLWTNNHYSAYCYQPTVGLVYSDSLGLEPPSDVLCVFAWLLEGLGYPIPPCAVHAPIPLQGPASGSCGVAATSFIETQINPNAPVWSGGNSELLRDRFLKKLLAYH
ncbi:hypothetical protein GLOTRDRAFT_23664, partial [Gloeophyllum trabeum ATCC 11539]